MTRMDVDRDLRNKRRALPIDTRRVCGYSVHVGRPGVISTVRLQEFRKLVRAEFGDGLEHATPANVREFLDRFQDDKLLERVTNRLVINEPCSTYEEVLKDFFAGILELPPEEAMVKLWTLALELAFLGIESQYTDRFASLFQDTD